MLVNVLLLLCDLIVPVLFKIGQYLHRTIMYVFISPAQWSYCIQPTSPNLLVLFNQFKGSRKLPSFSPAIVSENDHE